MFLAVALSGSGQEIAVGLIPDYATSPRSPVQLRVYSVTTGKLERAWSTSDQTAFGGPGRASIGSVTATALTWVDDDRALAFPTISAASNPRKHEDVTHETMRLLDMSADGSDLIAASRVIWSTEGVSNPFTGDYSQLSCANASSIIPMLTADGKTIVCAAVKPLTPRGPFPQAADAGRWRGWRTRLGPDRGPHRGSGHRRRAQVDCSCDRPAVGRLVGWHADRHVDPRNGQRRLH